MRIDSYSPDFFDAITILQVLEHIPDPDMYIKLARELISPDGILVVEVPSLNDWGIKFFGKRHRHFVPDHLNFFNRKTLELLLEKNGFRTVYTYYPYRWLSLRFFFQWVEKQSGLKKTNVLRRICDSHWFRSCGLPISIHDIVTIFAIRND